MMLNVGEQMEIGELGLEVWRIGMITPLGQRLVKLLLEAVEQDRLQGTTAVPVEAVRGTILSFVQVYILYLRNILTYGALRTLPIFNNY